MEVRLSLDKSAAMTEVSRLTHYIAAKLVEVENNPTTIGAYNRIPTVDEDADLLDRFWSEARGYICNRAKKRLVSEAESDGTYALTLDLPDRYNTALNTSVQQSLLSFFIYYILSRWLLIVHKDEADAYSAMSLGCVDDIMDKITHNQGITRRPMKPF